MNVNTMNKDELEMYKRIGDTISTNIINERKKSHFKDLKDLKNRVKGLPNELEYEF